jgi:uncharacterized membrane protein (UPF0182 family)
MLGLILLRVAGDVLVDWLWFSALGYLQVFWISLAAQAAVFAAAFAATALTLWLNGWLALRLVRASPRPRMAASALHAPPDPFALARDRLPWLRIIAAASALVAMVIAASEAGGWPTLLRYLYKLT